MRFIEEINQKNFKGALYVEKEGGSEKRGNFTYHKTFSQVILGKYYGKQICLRMEVNGIGLFSTCLYEGWLDGQLLGTNKAMKLFLKLL